MKITRGRFMRPGYHRVAGQSLERLAALSDGIFAVAMTLLVLDLRVPVGVALQAPLHRQHPLWVGGAIGSERVLLDALVGFAPSLLTYLMSFLTLGIFWVGQQTQLGHFARSDRDLAWMHLAFLCAVALMPFSTSLLSEFIAYRLPLVVYWLNLLLLGAALYFSWRYAERSGLVKEDVPADARAVHLRRIVTYQALYAIGMLPCVVSTYASIAFIILLQLNSAISPRLRPLGRSWRHVQR